MWVTTLNIVTLLFTLAALGYVALAARRLDARLGALVELQSQRRFCIEHDLERSRRLLETSFPVNLPERH